jgi:hypothetical protein
MPHKNSLEKLQARLIQHLIFSTSYYDHERCEIISRLSHQDILAQVNVTQVSLVPVVEKGEVLVNSRGEGSFQRIAYVSKTA